MAGIGVTPSTSYTVAADVVGGDGYQRVKLDVGVSGVTSGDVGLTNPLPVTGTVSVSGQVQVSGTVTAGAGTTVVSIGNVVPVTTQSSVSVSGLPVWFAPGVTVAVVPGVSVNALVTGVVSVSAMPAVSVSVSAVLGTVVTLLGTVAVNVVAGAAGGGSVTTTAPGITATGQVMWIAGGQSTSVSPVFVSVGVVSVTGVSLNVVVSGVVSVSVLPAVSISVSAVLGTIITQLGTQVVTVVPGLSVSLGQLANVVVSTTASSGQSGPVVWLGQNQFVQTMTGVSIGITGPVSISVMPAVSISVSAALGTVITILGTQVVSVVPGVSVGITVSAALGTVITILGTQIVSVVPGVSVIAQLSSIVPVTTAASVSVSGIPVWLNPTQQVSIASVLLQPVIINLSSTLIGPNTTLLFSVYTGNTFVTTGASFWAVPAGKVFRVMAMQMQNVSSAVLGVGKLMVIVGTAAASLSVTSTVGVAAMLPWKSVV